MDLYILIRLSNSKNPSEEAWYVVPRLQGSPQTEMGEFDVAGDYDQMQIWSDLKTKFNNATWDGLILASIHGIV